MTSKHSHTNNPHSKQCQYVSSTKGSLAQFEASKNKTEGKPPNKDVILTFYKFPSQNDKQQGEATLVPAVKQTTNKGDGSSEKKIFLPRVAPESLFAQTKRQTHRTMWESFDSRSGKFQACFDKMLHRRGREGDHTMVSQSSRMG